MKTKFLRSYKKLNKNNVPVTIFVYSVSGDDESMEKFKSAQGENFREDENGQALWFSTRFAGNNGTLIVSSDGKKVFPDMSAFDQAASLASQYGGNLGDALAKAAAQMLTGAAQPAVVQPQPTPSEKE